MAKKRRLTTFEEFILTLVRLRQVLIVQDLSDFIAISKYSVSKVRPCISENLEGFYTTVNKPHRSHLYQPDNDKYQET